MTQDNENLQRSFVRVTKPIDSGVENMIKRGAGRVFKDEEELNAHLEVEKKAIAEEPLNEMKILKDFFKRCKKPSDIVPEWKRCGGLERKFLIKAMERLIRTKGRR
jgi:hypothetical protein